MEKNYDQKYEKVIRQMDEMFVKEDPWTKTINVQSNEEKLPVLTGNDWEKINKKITAEIEEASGLGFKERHMIEMVRKGKWNRYRQKVFKLVGDVDMNAIMERYAKLVREQKELRTVYLYRNMDVACRVLLKQGDKVFPVHDISYLDQKKQSYLIKNVMAAEARHEFDPETDSILNLRGFLVADNEMIVVVADYQYVPMRYGIRDIVYQIFSGMRMNNSDAPVVKEQDVQKMNAQFRERSLAYWQKLLLPLGKKIIVPGEKTAGDTKEETCFYGELSEEDTHKILSYCKECGISSKALFLSVWGNMLGRYCKEEHPVMAMYMKGECMNFFPVVIDRGQEELMQLQEVDRQIETSKKNSGCTDEELQEILKIQYPEYFHIVQRFMEFSEVDQLQNTDGNIQETGSFQTEDEGIALTVTYQMFNENISVIYNSRMGMFEQVLEQIHKAFAGELMRIVAAKQQEKVEEIPQMPEAVDEEKLYQVYLEKICSYIQNTGLFESISVKGQEKLAEVCKVHNCLLNDVILSEGSECQKFYIVGEGNIEESMTALDGMVKSIRILKPGDIFGTESLLKKRGSSTTYTVVGKEAKIVSLDRNILMELFKLKPECWIELLEREMDQKKVLQRLWTMN